MPPTKRTSSQSTDLAASNAPDQNAVPIPIGISDIDVVRMGFGPRFNGETISPGAERRLGDIGRGVLAAELPVLFGTGVAVTRTLVPLSFELRQGLTPGKIRQGIAHVLENSDTLQTSMVRVIPEPESKVPAEDIDDFLDETVATPTPSSPDQFVLRTLRAIRSGKVSATHPKEFFLQPIEAIHFAVWAARDSEVEHEPYKRLGPYRLEWNRTAMIEMMASAPAEVWGKLLKHVTAFDPSVALFVVQQRLWSPGWAPSPEDLKPLLTLADATIRAQAIQAMQALRTEHAGEIPSGEGGLSAKHERRVPKKLGY